MPNKNELFEGTLTAACAKRATGNTSLAGAKVRFTKHRDEFGYYARNVRVIETGTFLGHNYDLDENGIIENPK